MQPQIFGTCEPAFSAVADEFERNFIERGEVGAAVTVIENDRVVVELWGGFADLSSERAWTRDTLVNFYSAGKPLIATLLLSLVDEGRLTLDQPICTIWPEFARGNKQDATIRHALCHRAGVPAIFHALTNDDLWDWDVMTSALARTPAWFVPGSRHVYHTNTYGHLVGEIIARVSGERPGERLAKLVSARGADLYFGVPTQRLDDCATVILAPELSPTTNPARYSDVRSAMIWLGYFNPPGYSSFGVVNSDAWRRAQIPSTNGHGTATGLAVFYADVLTPGKLLSADLLAEATKSQSVGFCPVLGEDVTFGLGFQPSSPRRPFGPHESSFGHFGTGGAVGFADPDAGIAFGYVMNHVIPRWQSSRNRALIDALYGARKP